MKSILPFILGFIAGMLSVMAISEQCIGDAVGGHVCSGGWLLP